MNDDGFNETAKLFLDELVECEETSGKNHVSNQLFLYLKTVMIAIKTDTSSKDLVEALLDAIMVNNKHVYDNYITDDISELLDEMVDIVSKSVCVK